MAAIFISNKGSQMKLYQKRCIKPIHTWIYFFMHNATGSEFLDYKLPFPNFVLHTHQGVFIGWKINGYPGTQEAREYFNDIIARFIITFSEYKPERLDYPPKKHPNALIDLKPSYELSQFQNLKSITSLPKEYKTTESIAVADQTFWAIKLYTEDLIRSFGEGIPVPYDSLEEFAMRNFYDKKDRSTLRAKCRNIWNWYDKRNWTIPTKKKELEMTREERSRANAQLKKKRARATILGFIQDNSSADEYKKRDGTWNVTRLSKATKLSRPTIILHLKELQEEGLI